MQSQLSLSHHIFRYFLAIQWAGRLGPEGHNLGGADICDRALQEILAGACLFVIFSKVRYAGVCNLCH